jgi:tetratricopeptide (TPR) repeat protein
MPLAGATPGRSRNLFICLGLAAITFAVFGQTAGFSFVNFDDPAYVYQNPVVQQGLTWKGLGWALTYGEIGHWHPLTWVSHMVDCQLYGVNPAGPHLANVALQALAAALLFLALNEMTGAPWRSAFVAALFAIHPLRAESVAWVSERKDVLSGVFFMLTLWAYACFARRPSAARYALVPILFAAGLLCKNTLITTPFVLLLLDWWLLRRENPFSARLIKEKIPLFILSAGSAVATALAPEKILPYQRVPFLDRLLDAAASYGIYLRQLFYPAGLAVPYPFPSRQTLWLEAIVSLAALAAISAYALRARITRPYIITGWLWFLGMLVPAIGIIQISYYSHADRYTYLPEIGLCLGLVWMMADWAASRRLPAMAVGAGAALVLVALMACAWKQTSFWRNSETLWRHTFDCGAETDVAHYDLGDVYLEQGRLDDAIAEYQKALNIHPDCVQAHVDLAVAYRQQGKLDDSIAECREALRHKPDFAGAHLDLGLALRREGKTDQAIGEFQAALENDPQLAEARFNLGNTYLQLRQFDESIKQFSSALVVNPNYIKARNNLGAALLQAARPAEAAGQFRQALKSQPDDIEAQNNLAWIMATSRDATLRDGSQAVELARRACQETGGTNVLYLHTLAAALAEKGDFSGAISAVGQAAGIAQAAGQQQLAAALQAEAQRYQAGQPCRQ